MQPKEFKIVLLMLMVALAVGTLGVFFLFNVATSSREEYTTLPPTTTGTTTGQYVQEGESYVTISAPNGDMLIRDPRRNARTIDMGSDIFSLTSLENVSDTPFSIIFSTVDGTFAIGLEAEPLGQTRRAAEQYLASVLGVTEDDLCYLNIYVGTTDRINQFYGGKNLGLSFCPGSVQLE